MAGQGRAGLGAEQGWGQSSESQPSWLGESSPLSSQGSRPLPRLTPCQVMGRLQRPPQAGRTFLLLFQQLPPLKCILPSLHLSKSTPPPLFEPRLSPAPPDPVPALSPLPSAFSCCFICWFILFPVISVSPGFFCMSPNALRLGGAQGF